MASDASTDEDRPAARILGFLAELQHALDRFVTTGEPSSFDLRGLPMTRWEQEYLEGLLGRGEVNAKLRAAGESDVWETALGGVWFVVHRDAAEQILGKYVEVCAFPKLLGSQSEDVREALARMQDCIQHAVAQLDASEGPALHIGDPL